MTWDCQFRIDGMYDHLDNERENRGKESQTIIGSKEHLEYRINKNNHK